jgi:hypothetical protein
MKENTVVDTIKLAHSYLMQQDLRPRMHISSPLSDDERSDTQGLV